MMIWPGTGTVHRWIYAFLAMVRPAFLLGTAPVYAVGVAASSYVGYEPRLSIAVLGLGTVWCVQAMTHYLNEYWDVEADGATEDPGRFRGGSQVLVNSVVPRQVSLVAATGAFTAVLALSLVAILRYGAGARFLGLVGVSAFLGWAYSSPPLRLVARGVGESVVALVVGLLVPAVGYLLQTGVVDGRLLYVSLPLIPLTFATSLVTAIPDRDADRKTGKRTLAVRLGPERSVILGGGMLLVGLLMVVMVWGTVIHVPRLVYPLIVVGPLVAYASVAKIGALDSRAREEGRAIVVISVLGTASLATSAALWLG